MAHGCRPMLRALHPRPPPTHGWLPAHADGESQPSQTATEHVQEASPTPWNSESTHALEHLGTILDKQTGGSQHLARLRGITRRYTILRIHPQKRMRCME